jgi:hypothetical protein
MQAKIGAREWDKEENENLRQLTTFPFLCWWFRWWFGTGWTFWWRLIVFTSSLIVVHRVVMIVVPLIRWNASHDRTLRMLLWLSHTLLVDAVVVVNQVAVAEHGVTGMDVIVNAVCVRHL